MFIAAAFVLPGETASLRQLILADNLGKSVCLLNIFTFFVKSHSLSYVAGWFDHRPVRLIDWLTE